MLNFAQNMRSAWLYKFALIIVVLAGTSCKDLNQLISFNLETRDRVSVPPFPDSLLTDTLLGNEMMMIVTDPIYFGNYKKFETNKSLPENVEDVEAIDLIVRIDSGSFDFSFANNYSFYLSPSGQFFDDVELASIVNPEPGRVSLTFKMKPKNAEWLKIIRGNKYHLRMDYTMVKGLKKPVHLLFEMRFRLKSMPVK
ncbi:MAG: hypothetical protein K1X77_08120 [Bacteroidia bacterium]|jgi:hypothetical protein|nr:hypothetical protein [Bacteroidia bacterium]